MRLSSRALADWLLETLQKPARWDHPTAPPTGRSAAVATDRSEGDIVVVGVEGDSVKLEAGRTALRGDSGVVW